MLLMSDDLQKIKKNPLFFFSRQLLTCKWLLTSSLVRPSTFMSSRICLGVATA